jgi:hypothetical protein
MRSYPMGAPTGMVSEADVAAAKAALTADHKPRSVPLWAPDKKPVYRSYGLKPFVDKAAEQLGFGDRSVLLRTEGLWHMSQIQNSLGYLGDQDTDKARKEIFDRCMLLRNAMATAIVAVDKAMSEAAVAFGFSMKRILIDLAVPSGDQFTVPQPVPLTVDPAPSVPEREEEENIDEPEQLRTDEPRNKRNNVRPVPSRRPASHTG